MCSSEELIHDARQITLEEMIMTNETPMYLVPGRLTIKEKMLVGSLVAHDWDMIMEYTGTPIQPCADVKTVGWLDPALMEALRVKSDTLLGVTLANIETPTRNIPLVRRTDMEAQVARVEAEKDAEIARLQAKQPLYDRVVHENGELKLAVVRLQTQDGKALNQVIEERDECEQVISDLYHAAMGEYPEWSNNFGYRDAVEDVVDYVHALRTRPINEGAAK